MIESWKQTAAEAALEQIKPAMTIGIGTGSTADHFTRALGARVAAGLRIFGVPTSERTAQLAQSLDIPLTSLDDAPKLDLTIDGTDEFDSSLRLIKGGGGALLREKIVAAASERMIVIADETKQVEKLGKFPLPVEIAPFGAGATMRSLAELARAHQPESQLRLRSKNSEVPFVTDGGHYIIDIAFDRIDDPEQLGSDLEALPGVMGHGLFCNMAAEIFVGGENGVVRIIGRS